MTFEKGRITKIKRSEKKCLETIKTNVRVNDRGPRGEEKIRK